MVSTYERAGDCDYPTGHRRERITHGGGGLPAFLRRLGQGAAEPGGELRRDLRPDGSQVRRGLGQVHLEHDRLVPVHERRLAGEALEQTQASEYRSLRRSISCRAVICSGLM